MIAGVLSWARFARHPDMPLSNNNQIYLYSRIETRYRLGLHLVRVK